MWTKISLVSSLCFRYCRKKAATFDQHLYRLFDDLRNSEAKTHNIVKNLGITNGQFGFKASLLHFVKNPAHKITVFMFPKTLPFSICATWCSRVFWKDPVSDESGCSQGIYLFFLIFSKCSSTYSLSDILSMVFTPKNTAADSFQKVQTKYPDNALVVRWGVGHKYLQNSYSQIEGLPHFASSFNVLKDI